MSVQTSVTDNPVAGYPGLEFDTEFSVVEAKVAAGAIPFGAYVVFKVDGEAILPAASGDVTGYEGGIALEDRGLVSQAGYVAGDVVRVLTRGKAWAKNEEALALGETIYVRHTDAGALGLGVFRNDADTSDASEPATKVKVAQGGATELAVLQVG